MILARLRIMNEIEDADKFQEASQIGVHAPIRGSALELVMS
jgi:hypothetical protein